MGVLEIKIWSEFFLELKSGLFIFLKKPFGIIQAEKFPNFLCLLWSESHQKGEGQNLI